MITIGKKVFKDSSEVNDYMSDLLDQFLNKIDSYKVYTEPARGDFPLHEYEEGISFYYTRKGMNLVDRWKRRMKIIYDFYCDDNNFNPISTMYKEF